ncbi:MAG: ATP-binding protein [Cytophagales bacterium]|nr:ATP-binding protein [Cytophagales bacterium]
MQYSPIKFATLKRRPAIGRENTIKLYNTILNSLSHELRTPIATVIGAVDTIKSGHLLSEKIKSELIDEIDVAAMRLDTQVENLLSMGRIEAGVLKPKPDWCDVNELINSILVRLKSEQGNRVFVFNPSENLPLFWLDRGLVEQIIVNIVRNGLQHTPDKSIITIQLVTKEEGCCISIEDNGNGFKEEDLKLVFDKFFRAWNAKTGGTGLGLSIAKGFADAMRGRIEVQNKPEGGAQFFVYLPAESNSLSYHEND